MYFFHAHVVSDFIFLHTRVHVEGIFAPDAARSDAPKDFIMYTSHSPRGATHAALATSFCYIEMAMQLHLSIFSRQFGYSA